MTPVPVPTRSQKYVRNLNCNHFDADSILDQVLRHLVPLSACLKVP